MDSQMGREAGRAVVYVDALPFADRWLTGIARHTARLALALRTVADVRFFAEEFEIQPAASLSWSQEQDLQRWAKRVWRGKRVPLGGGVIDAAAVYPWLRPAARRFAVEISVMHDFTPLVVPQTHTETTRRMFQGFYATRLLSSDWAIAVSHNTKHDASWLCDFPQERIVACHSGPSLCVHGHLSEARARRPNVALVVGTLEPRKNADFLLEWFRDSTAIAEGTELWWVGNVGWLTSRRRLDAFRRLRGRRIRLLGKVSDERLCELYQTARVSIYPSLYEGFGFPVLDALRHGTPVLTSYNSALREFEGLRGVDYFDPCDAATLDAAWARVARCEAEVAGLDELNERYDWGRVARAVVELAGAERVGTRRPETRAA